MTVISLRSAVRSIANADSSDLAKFTGVSSLKPFINNEIILAELLDFSIPGTQFTGRGMTTEHFELICRGSFLCVSACRSSYGFPCGVS